jgi:ATPase family associated with various cellular activities (AAA)
VPGLAKTLLIKTVAEILDVSFKRIQFTPDLMPADITGTEVLDEANGHRALRFVTGPIFAQIILADEINRTPPKTQAALLEAMQEYHVTAAGRTYQLERPFFVLATQNPTELERADTLPEAQLEYAILMAHEAMKKLAARYQFTPRPILIEIFPVHDDVAVRTLGLHLMRTGMNRLDICDRTVRSNSIAHSSWNWELISDKTLDWWLPRIKRIKQTFSATFNDNCSAHTSSIHALPFAEYLCFHGINLFRDAGPISDRLLREPSGSEPGATMK